MKVICDNCRAVYKIPDDKLVKPVNKATCRKCGHRMLIPRPRQGASPDEKTLVTAVPPTPAPAPSRDNGPATTPIEDEGENTMPGVPGLTPSPPGRRVAGPSPDDVPLYAATPMPPPERGDFAPPAVQPTPPIAPRHHAPPPAPDYGTPTGVGRAPPPAPAPAVEAQRPRRTPTPAPSTRPAALVTAPGIPPHDPGGDMLLAMVGTAGAMLGALVLVVAFAATGAALPPLTLAVIAIGMLLAFGGGMSTLLVILTGGRGRRAARPFVSVVLGTMLGFFVTSSAVALFVAKDAMLGGFGLTLPSMTAAKDEPVLAASTPEAPPVEAPTEGAADEAAPAEAAATEAVGTGSVAASTAAAPSASGSAASSGPVAQTFTPRATSGSSSSASQGTASETAPARAGELDFSDEDLTGPSTARTSSSGSSSGSSGSASSSRSTGSSSTSGSAAAASSLPPSVPDDVIDTILRNNIDLKKCFFNHKKSTGTLPSRVTVSFQLQPAGKITDASVADSEYSGTELDSCLSRTLHGIAMPPFDGTARRVKYPFQLQ